MGSGGKTTLNNRLLGWNYDYDSIFMIDEIECEGKTALNNILLG